MIRCVKNIRVVRDSQLFKLLQSNAIATEARSPVLKLLRNLYANPLKSCRERTTLYPAGVGPALSNRHNQVEAASWKTGLATHYVG